VLPGSYLDSTEQFNKYLDGVGTYPAYAWDRTVTLNQITDPANSKMGEGSEEFKVIGGKDNLFPPEYSVGGWFKWSGAFNGWHMMYRFTINNKPDNQDASRLGDRTLAVFFHPNMHYYPATYHYVNMNMGGDANRWDSVFQQNQHTQWHFVYFGYSKLQKRAYFTTQYKGTTTTKDYPATNHYWAEKFWFALKDARYQFW
jgi:hypothetical protein